VGNLIDFRRDADPVPLDVASNVRSDSSKSTDLPESLQANFSGGVGVRKTVSWKLPIVFKRFGLTRFVRETAKVGAPADLDAYLLVLLADQELIAGRDDQAQTLLDAAYAVFDRQAHGERGAQHINAERSYPRMRSLQRS
jgi:hypothetical protein